MANAALARNPAYSSLTADDVSYFASILNKVNVITDSDDLKIYNRDWMNKFHGNSKVRVLSMRGYCNILYYYLLHRTCTMV